MSWEKAKLGEVCTIEKGNIGIMKAISGEFPLVVLGAERRTHNEYQFDDEAVIIPLVSSTGHGHRSMKRIFYQTGKFSVGSILCAVIPKDKSKLSAEFLYRYLDFNKENELVARMKGMANVSLPMKEIASVEIPLPPIEHQKKLIEEFQKLETSNNQITTELSHQLELVRQLRQAFLCEAMQGKLVPQDEQDEPAEILLGKIKAEKEKLIAEKKIKKDKPLPEIKSEEIPFEIPNNWTWCRLGEIADMKSGNQYLYAKCNSGIMYVKVGDMNLDQNEYEILVSSIYFDKASIKKNDLIPIRSIIFPKRGGAIATNKRRAILKEPILVDSNTMAVIPSNEIDFDFFWWWFNTINLAEFGNVNIIPQVNNKDLIPLSIPLPSLAEQKRIVEKLEKLMKYCDGLEANIRESKANAESLLQVALKEALEPN